jgi:hypothetical protein
MSSQDALNLLILHRLKSIAKLSEAIINCFPFVEITSKNNNHVNFNDSYAS